MRNRRTGLHSIARIRRRCQRLPINLDGSDRIFAPMTRVGDHHGQGLTHIGNLARRQKVRHHGLADGRAGQQKKQAVITHVAGKIGQRINFVNTRHGQRGFGVNCRETGVRMRAADKYRMQHIRGADIVGELTPAGQQGRIFKPFYGRPKEFSAHSSNVLPDLARKQMDRADTVIETRNAAAGAMGQPYLGAFDLAVSALAAQLTDNFDDLGNAGGPDGVPLG